jgi:S-adenosylmethionine decarboxylase
MKQSPTNAPYCGTNGHVRYAGVHLVIEFWQAEHLDDVDAIERIMRQAVQDCGATLLHIHLHEFPAGGGVSGVGVLMESHISVHTWPEFEYAAVDVFFCGTLNPYDALPALKEGFRPGQVQMTEMKRGVLEW